MTKTGNTANTNMKPINSFKFKYCYFCGKKLIPKETMFDPISGEVIKNVVACPDWQEEKAKKIFGMVYDYDYSKHAIYTFGLGEILLNKYLK